MSKFTKGKKKKEGASITTAALPDIVFMLLFFFMVATKSKTNDSSVMVTLPSAVETGKLEDKTPTAYINIGVPVKALQDLYGKVPRIYLNDAIKNVGDVQNYILDKKGAIEKSYEDAAPGVGKSKANQMIVCLKIDQKAKSGLVDEVKQELRKTNALKVNYLVNKAGK